jgi:hypothetical protein
VLVNAPTLNTAAIAALRVINPKNFIVLPPDFKSIVLHLFIKRSIYILIGSLGLATKRGHLASQNNSVFAFFDLQSHVTHRNKGGKDTISDCHNGLCRGVAGYLADFAAARVILRHAFIRHLH